ncbi:MAG: hypothetical protein HQM02_04080 [Magnetococcales bacterium]|nr:hypothetical protein [Magnetococcales bacterium]
MKGHKGYEKGSREPRQGYASPDDMRWISRCMRDNAGARVPPSVVSGYCTCMNDKMSDNETRSISEWEKSHPRARAACERQAGWR